MYTRNTEWSGVVGRMQTVNNGILAHCHSHVINYDLKGLISDQSFLIEH